MNEKQLTERLKKLPVADGLQAKLEANWQQQLTQTQGKNNPSRGAVVALVASVLVVFGLMFFYYQPPTLISLAYADIVKDAKLQKGFSAEQQRWFKQHNLAAVPANMALELIKNCRLGEQTHVHLRVAGEHQGKVNVFIRQASPRRDFHADAGELQGLRWHRFILQNNLQVLVLYDEKMRKQGVNHLLKTVFADYQLLQVSV